MSRVLNEGSPGSNGGGPSADVFFKHQRAFTAAQTQKMAAVAAEKKAKKAAEEDGVLWDDLKTLNKLQPHSAAVEEASRINRMKRYLQYMKHPLGDVLVMLSENIGDETGLTDEQRQEKWTNHGYVASRSGKGLPDSIQGHDPNGDTGRWIREGWEKGQAENAAGIRAKKTAAASAPAAEEKIVPKQEQEVLEAAKRRGRPPKETGITYWHNADLKKVYKVTTSDATPEGAVNITKPEFERLDAEYTKAAADDWEQSAPKQDDESASTGAKDDGFDSPPTP